MQKFMLFQSRTPMNKEGLPFISGCEQHRFFAARNTTGSASASALLVRALIFMLEGAVLKISSNSNYYIMEITSSSTPGAMSDCTLDWIAPGIPRYFVPHGEEGKITYQVGVLAAWDAIAHKHPDFCAAYAVLLEEFLRNGKKPSIKESLLRCADELYYWLIQRDGSEDISSRIELHGCTEARAYPYPMIANANQLILTTPALFKREMGMKSETEIPGGDLSVPRGNFGSCGRQSGNVSRCASAHAISCNARAAGA